MEMLLGVVVLGVVHSKLDLEQGMKRQNPDDDKTVLTWLWTGPFGAVSVQTRFLPGSPMLYVGKARSGTVKQWM